MLMFPAGSRQWTQTFHNTDRSVCPYVRVCVCVQTDGHTHYTRLIYTAVNYVRLEPPTFSLLADQPAHKVEV